MAKKYTITSDLQDIIKLGMTLLILIGIAWFISFYSRVDNSNKQYLFSAYELSQWEALESNQVLYYKENSSYKKDSSLLAFEISSSQWDKILSDFTQVYVLEELDNPTKEIINSFSEATCLTIYKKQNPISLCLGNVNSNTGNFLIKFQNSYFIAKTEMYFEGLYQSEVEGNRLSYHRFLSYFKEPFKSLYGKNFWAKGVEWSLKTKKNTLFSISVDLQLLVPVLPPEVKVDQVLLSQYLHNFKKWIPAKGEKLDSNQQVELSTTYDFLISVKDENGKIDNFALLNNGLWWLEKNIFFTAPQIIMDQLIALPDSFYQKKIVSMAEFWTQMQKGEIESFEWKDLLKNKSRTILSKEVIANPPWQQFFCLLSGCLSQGISVVMKVKLLNEAEFEQQLKMADHQLRINTHSYYFRHDPYRLEVITPQKYHFIFVSRLKELYP